MTRARSLFALCAAALAIAAAACTSPFTVAEPLDGGTISPAPTQLPTGSEAGAPATDAGIDAMFLPNDAASFEDGLGGIASVDDGGEDADDAEITHPPPPPDSGSSTDQ